MQLADNILSNNLAASYRTLFLCTVPCFRSICSLTPSSSFSLYIVFSLQIHTRTHTHTYWSTSISFTLIVIVPRDYLWLGIVSTNNHDRVDYVCGPIVPDDDQLYIYRHINLHCLRIMVWFLFEFIGCVKNIVRSDSDIIEVR